jgi:uncharacterized protein (TIGR01777 family)
MTSNILWSLILVQMAFGLFDIVYHHELTERLAWRPSQQRELMLHGVRNFAYAALFLVFGWLEIRGIGAYVVLAIVVAETIVTLTDFVEEDRSRALPPTERITHAILAINYGAIIALLAPILLSWAAKPAGLVLVYHGYWSWLTLAAAPGVMLFGFRDIAASYRSQRLSNPPIQLTRGLTPGQRILVTGATGFIGRRLVQALALSGHEVVVLARDPQRAAEIAAPVTIVTNLDQISSCLRLDAIVNLAGEPIANALWTRRKRYRILASRLRMTRQIISLIARLDSKPRVLINGSAIGWYGLRRDEELTEKSIARDCFSHQLCSRWERIARRAHAYGVRVVLLRIGLVLDWEGGLLGQMLVPFEFGLGVRFGNGRQWMSWIARTDVVRLIAHAIATPTLSGVVNATAPNPTRNRDFVHTLAKVLHRPLLFFVPALALRAAGAMGRELLLGGQRVVPARAMASGFTFLHETLDDALAHIVGGAEAPPVRDIFDIDVASRIAAE